MTLTLYHNDMSVCSQKVRLALAEKGLAWEGKHLNLRQGDQTDPAYLRLNPNGVVPTLVDAPTSASPAIHGSRTARGGKGGGNEVVVIESVVINEYLDDAYPDPPLKPAAAAARAQMRRFTRQIDAGIFAATGIVSMSIAFHHQFTPEGIAAIAAARPSAWRRRFEQMQRGVDNPAFPDAIMRLDQMLAEIERTLAASGPWLAGADFSLADIALAPYVTRLDHLGFAGMLDRRPHAAQWYERLRARPAYEQGLARWFNDSYLPLMAEKGAEAWPRVKALLAA